MNSVRNPSPRLANMVPYDPKYMPAQCMMSANENPRDIPEEVRHEVVHALRNLAFNRYPDPLAQDLRQAIADANGLDQDNVLMGNGGDELLFDIALAWGGKGRTFLNIPPTFSVYENNAQLTGTTVVNIPRRADYSIDEEAVLTRLAQGDIDYVIIASPNNPTGQLADETFLMKVLDASDALVVVDEAYFEFSRTTMRPYLAQHRNLMILRTFSKAFCLAGVRMGYVLANASLIRELIKVRQPYSVDAVSQQIACAVFKHRECFERGILDIIDQRSWLIQELTATDGVKPYPSDSNYILFKVESMDAHEVWEQLYQRGILIRDFSNGLYTSQCLRVSVSSEEDNQTFIEALRSILKGEAYE
ncbi:MAG: histidinol-phosphate transaminase [Eggerthellaceae bacterium]|nr:histidinol-phosphate transaminase [Eggerthellaceae bacterium]